MLVVEVLQQKINQSEGRDEWTGQRVDRRHGENHHRPRVVNAEDELNHDGLADVRRFRCASRRQDSVDVHDEVGKANQLEGGADEGHGDDVIHEESTAVGQENAFELDGASLVRQAQRPLQKGRRRE